MIAEAWSDDPSLQLESTTHFRMILSNGKFDLSTSLSFLINLTNHSLLLLKRFFMFPESPPIDQVIQSGVVPCFVEFLKKDDFPKLQVREKVPINSYFDQCNL